MSQYVGLFGVLVVSLIQITAQAGAGEYGDLSYQLDDDIYQAQQIDHQKTDVPWLTQAQKAQIAQKRKLHLEKLMANNIDQELHIDDVHANVDYESGKVVVTANVLNKQKSPDNFMFGGAFSPTVATYLKPLTKSKVRAFVQVRCAALDCSELAVTFGVRNTIGNPYAYSEQKFILSSN